MDRELAEECRAKVRSGKWQCFTSEIRVKHIASKKILGEAFLGGSIYANPADFRDHFGMNHRGHGSYFSQMVREAIEEARKTLPVVQKTARKEFIQFKKLQELHLRKAA